MISAALASYRDAELSALVDAGVVAVGVGGGTSIIDVEGVRVFVKRIALTDQELADPGSTANLFNVPEHCQYGIVSPGFNVWRELASNVLVTEAVLAGETRAFPVLYHWRVLPGRPAIAPEYADIDAMVAAWGDSPAVRTRLVAKAAASSSLVMFSEYIPRPLVDWLREDPAAKAATVERQFTEIATFLHDRELLHMDAHLGNMRTDDERIVLTDFGLATSPRFDLSPAERTFAKRHAGHDSAYMSMRLVNWLVTAVCGGPTDPAERNVYVRRCANGDIPANVLPHVAAILARHATAAATMNAFYWRLFDGEIHAEYPGP